MPEEIHQPLFPWTVIVNPVKLNPVACEAVELPLVVFGETTTAKAFEEYLRGNVIATPVPATYPHCLEADSKCIPRNITNHKFTWACWLVERIAPSTSCRTSFMWIGCCKIIDTGKGYWPYKTICFRTCCGQVHSPLFLFTNRHPPSAHSVCTCAEIVPSEACGRWCISIKTCRTNAITYARE